MEERGRYVSTQLQLMECTGRVFAKSLEDIAVQEDNAPLAKCLETLSECGQQMTIACHNVMIKRPETEILEVLNQIQDYAIVPMKKLLEDREKAVNIQLKLQLEHSELKRGSATKDKKLRMLSDQKRRVENVNALLDTHMENFDRYRTEKMMKIVSELARSQAFYHAKGLELFAVPCEAIAAIYATDGKGAAQVVLADAT
ncbi:unnamed protein product [Peronospora destructor]|uniref:BAR domain-containing protein n=1 Tax=Peronospora destructor TaxID=86335 RepID=A0AAV0V686_9STRA|nr:unnamed protein product [Peronospora destructor]